MDKGNEGRNVDIGKTLIMGDRVFTRKDGTNILKKISEGKIKIPEMYGHSDQFVACYVPKDQSVESTKALALLGHTVVFVDTNHKVPLNDGFIRDLEDSRFIIMDGYGGN